MEKFKNGRRAEIQSWVPLSLGQDDAPQVQPVFREGARLQVGPQVPQGSRPGQKKGIGVRRGPEGSLEGGRGRKQGKGEGHFKPSLGGPWPSLGVQGLQATGLTSWRRQRSYSVDDCKPGRLHLGEAPGSH